MRLTSFPPLRLAVGLLLAAVFVSPAGAAEPQPITFDFTFGNGTCLDGTAAPGASLAVSLATGDGQPKGNATATADGAGRWHACVGSVIRAGDVLSATGGGSSRSFAVPRLSAAINRVSDVVRGVAPAGSSVRVRVTNCPGFGSCSSAERTVAVGSGGTYQTDFTARFDVVGADAVRLRWLSPDGDHLTLMAWTPYLDVWRPTAYFSGAVGPSQLTTIELRDSAGLLRGRGRAVGEWLGGWIEGELLTAAGAPQHPRVGDRVSADFARDAAFAIADLEVTGRAESDTVSGRCGPGDYYRVVASRPGTSASVHGRSDSGGSFADSFAGRMDLEVGDRLALSCKRTTGDLSHIGAAVD